MPSPSTPLSSETPRRPFRRSACQHRSHQQRRWRRQMFIAVTAIIARASLSSFLVCHQPAVMSRNKQRHHRMVLVLGRPAHRGDSNATDSLVRPRKVALAPSRIILSFSSTITTTTAPQALFLRRSTLIQRMIRTRTMRSHHHHRLLFHQ